MWLRFIHGAGGYADDRELADGLGVAVGAAVDMPNIPDDDMSFEAWASPVRRVLASMGAADLLIAHSFGASVLLRVLAEEARTIPSRAVLLAMPDWSPQGWDIAEYAFDGPEPGQVLSLHHCRDDEVVPFGHLAVNSRRLPSARVHEHRSGGHQFDGLVKPIAADALRGR
jgi:predicted alpha/beta hydrolase family esterase